MRCFRQGCDRERKGKGNILEVGAIEHLDRFKEKRNEIRLLGFWLEQLGRWNCQGLEVRKTRDVQILDRWNQEILDMLGLRFFLDIHVEMAGRQLGI